MSPKITANHLARAAIASSNSLAGASISPFAHDLPTAWNGSTADTRTKRRLIHIPIQEIFCDLGDAANEVVLLIQRLHCPRHSPFSRSRIGKIANPKAPRICENVTQ